VIIGYVILHEELWEKDSKPDEREGWLNAVGYTLECN